MRAKFLKELSLLGLPQGPLVQIPVSERDLEGLPEPAQRYLRFMKVLGKPRDWSFRLSFTGRFRRSRNEDWLNCETWQYNNRPGIARIFHIRARIAGFLPILARDLYLNGQGRMLVRFLDLYTVVDGRGEEYNIGELVTYLNDGVMIAPSMLLSPEVCWLPVDGNSFDVALRDRGRMVMGRVFVNEQGAPTDFSTTDRFCEDPKDPGRLLNARWSTPIEGWQELDGRRLPTRARAVWHLPDGPFPYAAFSIVPGSAAFNVQPGK